MAYDVMVSIQKLQNDLIAINNVIGQKLNQSLSIKSEKEPEKEEKVG